ncbi:hypothetical protein [Bdellovibrio bacteriovorus]|uniref:hypothetical protein n=1 Tax=Bdellovibrio bacteriovorus TaxID=959 RepID=UPI0035A60381
MKPSLSFKLVLASSLMVTACSFQKNPDKTPPKPEVIKVGMTKEELQEEIEGNAGINFPDQISFALKNEDMSLFYKLMDDVSEYRVNDYGKDGTTALDFMILHEQDQWAASLLEKGASPYKRRRGTQYSILKLLEEKKDQLPFTKAALLAADEDLYKRGRHSMSNGSSALMFYWSTHFPMKASIQGKRPLLYTLFDEKESLKEIRNEGLLHDSHLKLLYLIEGAEGEIKEKVDEFLNFFFEVEDLGAFEFFLRKRTIEADQRKNLISKFQDANLFWLKQITPVLRFSDEEKSEVSKNIINSLKNRKDSAILKAFRLRSVLEFTMETYPEVYEYLYERFKNAEFQIKEDVVDNGDLPGGKVPNPERDAEEIYRDFLNDENRTRYFED